MIVLPKKQLQESTDSLMILFLWKGIRKGRYILQQSHFPVPLLHLMDFSMDRDKRGWFWSEVSFRRTRCQIPASAWIWWNLMMMIVVTINDGDHSHETVTKVLAILGNVTFFSNSGNQFWPWPGFDGTRWTVLPSMVLLGLSAPCHAWPNNIRDSQNLIWTIFVSISKVRIVNTGCIGIWCRNTICLK